LSNHETRNPILTPREASHPHLLFVNFRSDSSNPLFADGDSAPKRACWAAFDPLAHEVVDASLPGESLVSGFAIAARIRIEVTLGGTGQQAGFIDKNLKFKPLPKICRSCLSRWHVGQFFSTQRIPPTHNRSPPASLRASTRADDDHVDFRLRRVLGRSVAFLPGTGTASAIAATSSSAPTGQPHRYVIQGAKCMWLLSTLSRRQQRWRRSIARTPGDCESTSAMLINCPDVFSPHNHARARIARTK